MLAVLRSIQMRPCFRHRGTTHLVGSSDRWFAADPPGPEQPAAEEVLSIPDPYDPSQHPLAVLGDDNMSEAQQYWRQRAAAMPLPEREPRVDKRGWAYATGKRKSSVARVWLMKGNGEIKVNGRNYVDIFHRVDHRDQVLRPFMISGVIGRFSVVSTVNGGGNTGQAEALRHGIAKALQFYDPEYRPTLKKDGLLTRDSRVVESKKYGRKKARKSFQWVKR